MGGYDDFEAQVLERAVVDMERSYRKKYSRCQIILTFCAVVFGIYITQQSSINLQPKTPMSSYYYSDYSSVSRSSSSSISSNEMKTTTSSSLLFNSSNNSPSFINTPGAILHLGRTGGSSIARHFTTTTTSGSNTNDSIKNNNNLAMDEENNNLSRIATYYHHRDFDSLLLLSNSNATSTTADITPTTSITTESNATMLQDEAEEGDNEQVTSQQQLQQPKYQFLIVTLRDPLDRTISSYAWMHPLNVVEQNNNTNYKNQQQSSTGTTYELFYNECFPSLDSFALAFENDTTVDVEYPTRRQHQRQIYDNNNTIVDCKELARLSLNNEIADLEYFYWDTKYIWNNLISSNSSNSYSSLSMILNDDANLYVIRLESMDEDWKITNELLGVTMQQPHDERIVVSPVSDNDHDENEMNATNVTSGKEKQYNSSSSNYQDDIQSTTEKLNSNNLQYLAKFQHDENRMHLCNALISEYDAYIQLLYHATNISPTELEKSLTIARMNCPNLELKYPM